MPRYAKETTVPVERSRAEIEETLRRYGASEFHSGWNAEAAMIAFRLPSGQGSLFIRFVLPMPKQSENRFTHKKDRWGYAAKRTEQQAAREWEQEIRQRWRALLLVIKAKLEAVECGISSIEKEFLAFIVIGEQTLGDWIVDEGRLKLLVEKGSLPQLGYKPSAPAVDAMDAEFEMKSS